MKLPVFVIVSTFPQNVMMDPKHYKYSLRLILNLIFFDCHFDKMTSQNIIWTACKFKSIRWDSLTVT